MISLLCQFSDSQYRHINIGPIELSGDLSAISVHRADHMCTIIRKDFPIGCAQSYGRSLDRNSIREVVFPGYIGACARINRVMIWSLWHHWVMIGL